MKFELVTLAFKNGNTEENLNEILNWVKLCDDADFILFGESIVQGFDALTWNPEADKKMALTQDSEIVHRIRKMAKRKQIGVGFGYIELDEETGKIYSSYQVVDKNAQILANYRRRSTGWREKDVDTSVYSEGNEFPKFLIDGKLTSIGLCGDFWTENVFQDFKNEIGHADLLLWPNYRTDWEDDEITEYAIRASELATETLFINGIDVDYLEQTIGAGYFKNGKVITYSKSDCSDKSFGFSVTVNE